MNFGQRLKLIRTSRELSQSQLATMADTTKATISRIERRGTRPYLSTVKKLADALNVKPALLLGDLK